VNFVGRTIFVTDVVLDSSMTCDVYGYVRRLVSITPKDVDKFGLTRTNIHAFLVINNNKA